MRYDPNKHHRRSIRLRGYDYSRAGAYFVTICTQSRFSLFGNIAEGTLHLNEAGQMIARWWTELTNKFPSLDTDGFVVMPNHFHGILVIGATPPTEGTTVGADLRVCPDPERVRSDVKGEHVLTQGEHVLTQGEHAGSPLPQVLQWFKTMTTNEYIRGVRQQGWEPFPGKLWQRNYYEHIIRNESSLQAIQRYIENNPQMWPYDVENPEFVRQPHQTEQDILVQKYGFSIEELDFVLNMRVEKEEDK